MFNYSFYKDFSFWCGVLLVILDRQAIVKIIEGEFFTSSLASNAMNLLDLLFFIGGVVLIFRVILVFKKNPK